MTITTIRPVDTDFPDCLRIIHTPPAELHVLGDLRPLQGRARLAVVGSRRASPYGRAVTTKLAGELAGMGVAIISGLAYGIDAISHQAALDNGGYTVAVLAGGLDDIHPRANARLAQSILDSGGALISEYPAGTPPQKLYFVARNRLIAGLADAVLIPEAALGSGSRHTAEFALDGGKTVMAVPGNVTSDLSRGTFKHIADGATPVATVHDVLAAMDLQLTGLPTTQQAAYNKEEALIISLLKRGASDSAELLQQSHLTTTLFNQTLAMLEITGRITSNGANRWMIVSP